MQFAVDSTVFDTHPELTLGIIVVHNADNTKQHDDLAAKLREAEKELCSTLDIDTFKEYPHIAAYQEAHRSFGSNPNKFPPSIQALAKRILKGGQLPTINPLVDLYNSISLRYIVCAGAEDIDKCTGDIQLTYAEGNEEFRLIGEEENDPPLPGELVYKDDVGVICRRLNWREGDRTRTDDNTKNAIIVVEGFSPISREHIENALAELETLLHTYTGATTEKYLLDKEESSCVLG